MEADSPFLPPYNEPSLQWWWDRDQDPRDPDGGAGEIVA